MDFEKWLASDNRLVWIQLMQDELLKAVPNEATALLKYGAKLEMLQSMKTWVLSKEQEPEEARTVMVKAGQHRRSH
jgi:hypothetical protein